MLDAVVNILNNSKLMYDLYFVDGVYLALYLLAFLYLLICEKDKLIKKLFFGQAVLFSAIYWFPVSAYIIAVYCIGADVYWRMFWILPATILIAYVLCKILYSIKERGKSVAAFVFVVYMITSLGSSVYQPPEFVAAANDYKLNQNVIEVCDVVKAHAKEHQMEDYGIIAPNELVIEIRQYDGVIRMPYGRDMVRGQGKKGYPKKVFECMNSQTLDTDLLVDLAREGGYHYLAYSALHDQNVFLDAGYTLLQTAGEYNVYFIE